MYDVLGVAQQSLHYLISHDEQPCGGDSVGGVAYPLSIRTCTIKFAVVYINSQQVRRPFTATPMSGKGSCPHQP